jgi:Tfp pilus assembly protein PilF
MELDALIIDRNRPAIARATALALWTTIARAPNNGVVNDASRDTSPLVRRAFARALSSSDLHASLQIPAALLSDPVRGVRIEAAEALAGRTSGELPSGLSAAFEHATDEYIAAQELNVDRPEAHLNLALLFARKGEIDRAESELRTAVSIDPGFAPATVNLADLYRESGHDSQGEAILNTALRRSPNDATLLHALGLWMVRQKKHAKAIELLGAAARSDPANARYAFVYAVALHDSRRTSDGINVLEDSIRNHPYDRDSLAALVDWCNGVGDRTKALAYNQRLKQLTAEAEH